MRHLATLALVAGTTGLTAFWVPPVWDYGYLQIIGGQVAGFTLGLGLMAYGRTGR